jgi:hypothetical protein
MFLYTEVASGELLQLMRFVLQSEKFPAYFAPSIIIPYPSRCLQCTFHLQLQCVRYGEIKGDF